MGNQYPYSTIWEGSFVEFLRIYGAKAVLYYFVFTNILNIYIKKWKLAYLNQF